MYGLPPEQYLTQYKLGFATGQQYFPVLHCLFATTSMSLWSSVGLATVYMAIQPTIDERMSEVRILGDKNGDGKRKSNGR
jgi:hypothetical protein